MLKGATMPLSVPASSPLDLGISLPLRIVSLPSIFTLDEQVPALAWLGIAIFGKGTGTNGAGGAGTLQTSGNAKHWPPPLVDAGNIVALLAEVDFLAVDPDVAVGAFLDAAGL